MESKEFFRNKKHCTDDGVCFCAWPKEFYLTVPGIATHLQMPIGMGAFDYGNVFDTRDEADQEAKHSARVFGKECYVVKIEKIGYWKEAVKPVEFIEC